MEPPSEGTRFKLLEHIGTIRFIGHVEGTTGTWLGVEWDDPERGKHDGTNDGKRYFSCRIPGTGSFIRPSPKIIYGTTFLSALTAKYIETPHGTESQEKVTLGSSRGAIEVEAVHLDKIRGKLANISYLREVSLDNDNVAKCDPPHAIQNICPSIRGLDLSTSLIPSWDVVAAITTELPALQRLALNRNRLQPAIDSTIIATAFSRLTELQLNRSMITWKEMQDITAIMPKLRLVELGHNGLKRLAAPNCDRTIDSAITTINLDSNDCQDWAHTCESLEPYRFLERIILPSNGIESIPFSGDAQQRLPSLKHISLSSNRLQTWSDIDGLYSWCPALETLSLGGNPLMHNRGARPFTIARLPSLIALDGAAISPKERTDCELFYLSYIAQQGPGTDDERFQAHPQWLNLCQKHGRPDEVLKIKDSHDKLSHRLIELNVYDEGPSFDLDASTISSTPTILRVLPTMTLRTLRLKICKTLKYNFKEVILVLHLKLDDNNFITLGEDGDIHDLSWLGIDNGSQIVLGVQERI